MKSFRSKDGSGEAPTAERNAEVACCLHWGQRVLALRRRFYRADHKGPAERSSASLFISLAIRRARFPQQACRPGVA
jgi:hypothetical protein